VYSNVTMAAFAAPHSEQVIASADRNLCMVPRYCCLCNGKHFL
jgi:hypothetical protein